MKKQFKACLLIALALICCLTVFACTGTIEPSDSGDSSDHSDSSQGSDPSVPMQSVELSKYSIIYPPNANRIVNAAVVSLSSQFSDKGYSLELGEDSEYEILLGNTGRKESTDAIAQIEEGKHYVIKFYEKKIVIAAKSDLVLEEAIATFMNDYVAKAENRVLKVAEGETRTEVAESLAILSLDGTAQYEIVFGSVSEKVKTRANDLVAAIAELGGNATVATGGVYDANKNQILIGRTTTGSTGELLGTLKANEYLLQKVGNKLVVSGQNENMTMLAIDEFIALMRDTVETVGASNTLAVALPTPIIEPYHVALDAIPEFIDGTHVGTFPSGNGNQQYYYSDVSASRVENYADKLEQVGYMVKEDNTIGNNRYVTCVGKNGMVHLTYLGYNKSLTVLTDPLTETVYKDSEPEYEKVTETTLAVMSLDFSHREVLDGNGMSYVVTLEDGRYIIFDGGYKNSKDANILYNYLADNNKRPDGKIVIAAWVMSHPHGDHHGAFEMFTSLYASRVKVQYFIYNNGDASRYSVNPGTFLSQTVPQTIAASYSGAKIIKPHTGQTLTFCNVTFEVMYTHENYAPNKIPSVNDASLVLRMNANGVTTLFTGDCEQNASNVMSKMYGSALQSDILQINHHGYSGGTTELYQYVNPSYSMWPTSQAAFEKRTTGEKYTWIGNAIASNKYIFDKLGASKCFVADGNIEMITFTGGVNKISVAYYTPDQTYNQNK